ncbi:MAG: prepilin-type N-terminal cleavage/methylation domain-containing protein [Rubritalea sp.]|jgi:prepilin-type N-terminal cleavage/methylation domain-containing protein
MKTNIQATQKRKRKGFTLVELLVVIAIIASLAGLSYGPIMKHLESSARTEAISNGKNVYTALLGYMTANDNSFPSGTAITKPEDAFQKLLDGGFVSDKKYFWNKANSKTGVALCSTDKPDNSVDILSPGENCWGYVNDLFPGSDSNKPIIFDSYNGSAFSTLTWQGKAVVVKVDGSARAMKIDYIGKPVDENGAGKTGQVFDDPDAATGVSIFSGVEAKVLSTSGGS